MTIHGEVVRLEPTHGFGFIRDDRQGDWFFVAAACGAAGSSLWVGERVAFTAGMDTPNGPRATDIHHESAGVTPTRLLLFDIDGTLVLTGGAGKRAMHRAFQDLSAWPTRLPACRWPAAPTAT